MTTNYSYTEHRWPAIDDVCGWFGADSGNGMEVCDALLAEFSEEELNAIDALMEAAGPDVRQAMACGDDEGDTLPATAHLEQYAERFHAAIAALF